MRPLLATPCVYSVSCVRCLVKRISSIKYILYIIIRLSIDSPRRTVLYLQRQRQLFLPIRYIDACRVIMCEIRRVKNKFRTWKHLRQCIYATKRRDSVYIIAWWRLRCVVANAQLSADYTSPKIHRFDNALRNITIGRVLASRERSCFKIRSPRRRILAGESRKSHPTLMSKFYLKLHFYCRCK